MEKEKQEVVADLYAIRAGLSVISEVKDRVQTIEKVVNGLDQKMFIPQRAIELSKDYEKNWKESYQRKIREREEKIMDIEIDIEDAEEELEEKREEINREKRKRNRNFIIALSVFILCAVIEIVSGLALFVGEIYDFYAIFILFAYGTIAAFIVFCVKLKKRKKDAPSFYDFWRTEDNVIESRRKIKNLQEEIKKLKSERESAFIKDREEKNRKLEEHQKEIEINQAAKNAALLRLKIEKANFTAVYKAMQVQFSPILDERDWKNVDLIIFNFETGRALDLRDALIQVDMERRNQRLISALAYATREISSTILRGFGEMTTVVSQKFDMLDRTIVQATMNFSSQIDEALMQNNEMKSVINKISSSITAQEALQERMNETSIEMAENILYLRNHT